LVCTTLLSEPRSRLPVPPRRCQARVEPDSLKLLSILTALPTGLFPGSPTSPSTPFAQVRSPTSAQTRMPSAGGPGNLRAPHGRFTRFGGWVLGRQAAQSRSRPLERTPVMDETHGGVAPLAVAPPPLPHVFSAAAISGPHIDAETTPSPAEAATPPVVITEEQVLLGTAAALAVPSTPGKRRWFRGFDGALHVVGGGSWHRWLMADSCPHHRAMRCWPRPLRARSVAIGRHS
jgi:hypothetical protein